MKRFLFLVYALTTIICNSYSQTFARVDERFELTSIAFAIAGAYEYNQCLIPSYKQDISNEFKQFSSTRAINFIRELNQKHQIGYNAISTTTEMLIITDGKINLKPEFNIRNIAEHDSRWNETLFSSYLEMLNEFYTDSNFRQFYDKHTDLYEFAEDKINGLLNSVSFDWFSTFFGISYEQPITIYISLTNGPNNYAMSNSILIGMQGDMGGMPTINRWVLQVLIHEIAHHYTNPLFDQWWSQIHNAAKVIYPHIESQMWEIGYSGEYTVFCEWLNNLFVLMYMKETNNSWYNHMIAEYTNKGFIWMIRSVEFLNNFYNNRDKYNYIDSFMPQIISFLNFTADDFDLVLREFEYRKPYIYSVYPAIGSDISNYDEIVVVFSEPMAKSWGFNGTGSDSYNIKALYISNIEWLDDYRLKLTIDNTKMPEKGIYAIELRSEYFLSQSYFGIKKETRLFFNKL